MLLFPPNVAELQSQRLLSPLQLEPLYPGLLINKTVICDLYHWCHIQITDCGLFVTSFSLCCLKLTCRPARLLVSLTGVSHGSEWTSPPAGALHPHLKSHRSRRIHITFSWLFNVLFAKVKASWLFCSLLKWQFVFHLISLRNISILNIVKLWYGGSRNSSKSIVIWYR